MSYSKGLLASLHRAASSFAKVASRNLCSFIWSPFFTWLGNTVLYLRTHGNIRLCFIVLCNNFDCLLRLSRFLSCLLHYKECFTYLCLFSLQVSGMFWTESKTTLQLVCFMRSAAVWMSVKRGRSLGIHRGRDGSCPHINMRPRTSRTRFDEWFTTFS